MIRDVQNGSEGYLLIVPDGESDMAVNVIIP